MPVDSKQHERSVSEIMKTGRMGEKNPYGVCDHAKESCKCGKGDAREALSQAPALTRAGVKK